MFESVKNNFDNEALVGQLLNEKRVADERARAAEEATRSKTKFFAAASHDLRQPLQAIGIYCSLLKKRATGPLEPLARSLASAVDSLAKLVEELLEISRLDAGAIQPRLQQVLLDEMLTQIAQEFTPLAHGKGLETARAQATAGSGIRPGAAGARACATCSATPSATPPREACCWRRGRAAAWSASRCGTPARHQAGRVVAGVRRVLSRRKLEGRAGRRLRPRPVDRAPHMQRPRPSADSHTRPGSGTVFRVETPLSALPHRGPRPPAR